MSICKAGLGLLHWPCVYRKAKIACKMRKEQCKTKGRSRKKSLGVYAAGKRVSEERYLSMQDRKRKEKGRVVSSPF